MSSTEQSSTPSLDMSRLYLSTDSDLRDDAGHYEIDTLLEHPELIPADWKNHLLVFAGARDEDGAGDRCVLSLDWKGDQWVKGFYYLGDDDWLPSDRYVRISPAP